MPIVPINSPQSPGMNDSPSLPPVRVRTRPAPKPEPQARTESAEDEQAAREPEYTVGYRKPPKHTQFKAGQSGNPKGRPKAAKGLSSLVRETLTQKVAVRTADGEKRISRIQAVLQKTVELAMKGNPRALAELLKLYANAVPDEKPTAGGQQEREEDLTAGDLAILAAFREELLSEQEADDEA